MDPLGLLEQMDFWYNRSFRARLYVEASQAEMWENEINNRTVQRIEELEDVRVGCANLCEISPYKIDQLAKIINRYELDIIWLIDLRKEFKGFKGYTTIKTKDPLNNCLLVRNSIYRNGEVLEIPFGIRFGEINFRYIRPNTPKPDETIKWENEIGDYNWLSNKWIKLNGQTEVRNGIPGGMVTNLQDPIFLPIKRSDHKMIIAKFKHKWIPKLEMNYYDLEEAMNRATRNKEWNIIRSRMKTQIVESKEMLNNKKKSNKIVDIVKLKLDVDPWRKLYNHNPNKSTNWKEQFTDFTHLDNTKSKAKDINEIKVKDAIKIFNKLNVLQKNNLMIAWKKLKRETRAIALKKKDVPVTKVTDTRMIQIYPVNLKINEYSRVSLKLWLEKQNKPCQYGFVKGQSTMTLLENLEKKFKNS